MPVDSSLSSNIITAHIPRPDQLIVDGLKYAGQNFADAVQSAISWLRSSAPRADTGVQRPRTDVRNAPGKAWEEPLPAVSPKPAVSGDKVIPADPKLVDDMYDYQAALHATGRQDLGTMSGPFKAQDGRVTKMFDAFDLQGSNKVIPDKFDHPFGGFSLPPSVLDSSLRRTDEKAAPGAPRHHVLFDPLTGFAAGIKLRSNFRDSAHAGEIIISFSGVGGQGATLRQIVRSFLNILGLTPPKNFQQAAKLTRVMARHIEALNAQRLKNNELPFKLTVCGHSMGGAMATFAALRTPGQSVNAVVFNPLRLGLLCRARVGLPAMKEAASKVKAYTVEGDWVYKCTTIRKQIGDSYFIPKVKCPTLDRADRNMLHNEYAYVASKYVQEKLKEDSTPPQAPRITTAPAEGAPKTAPKVKAAALLGL